MVHRPAQPGISPPKARGEGLTTEKADATLTFADGRPPVTKAKEVTAAVTELIGLDYNQFSQIAMIAQGRFTRLLNATTEERRPDLPQAVSAPSATRNCRTPPRGKRQAHRPAHGPERPVGRGAVRHPIPGRRP